MIIKEASLIPFSLKLNSTFKNSKSNFSNRNGLILKLVDESGNSAYGECSPLEGFSKESLQDAEKELHDFCKDVINKSNENFFNLSYSTSVNFCIEQAFHSLLLQHNFELKSYYQQSKKIKVNAVIGLTNIEEAINLISKKINLGYDTIKLKVGRENPYDDFLLIEKVREIFGNEIKIRLDANQKWNCDEAIEYLLNLEQFNIEYIEEPSSSFCSNLKTADSTNIQVALDESLTDFQTAQEFITDSSINFFVLKPMMFGFEKTLKLIELTESINKFVIISSSFESAIGKSGLVFLAAQTKHNYAHGLDTSEYFVNDNCEDFYKPNNSFINFDINKYPPKFIL
jgi:o-succinylbenzoate synthase